MAIQGTNGERKDPWINRRDAGFDLDRLLGGWLERYQRVPSGRGGLAPRLGVLAGLGLWTAGYTVPSDSVAVVQRFGKSLYEVAPGLHFKLPLGMEVATIVPVKRRLKQAFGLATPGATDPHQPPRPRHQRRETQMVTGDLNTALVEWVVHDVVGGLADVKATDLYARAYNQSLVSVDFYQFTRSLQAYKSVIGQNTTLLLSTDSELFNYLRSMTPGVRSAAAPEESIRR